MELKYTASTPVRKPQPAQHEGKDGSGPPPASGYWVYSPIRSGLHKSFSNRHADSEGDSQEESGLDDQEEFVPPPGYMMYTVFPDGSPVPRAWPCMHRLLLCPTIADLLLLALSFMARPLLGPPPCMDLHLPIFLSLSSLWVCCIAISLNTITWRMKCRDCKT